MCRRSITHWTLCWAATCWAATLLPVAATAAPIEIQMASAPLVALAEPRANSVLTARSQAVLAWQPIGPAAQFAEIDEWEAFLSLDGGSSYPLRITPQLDFNLRQVRWHVPSLASDHVRLLFHLGGQRQDGTRFEIALDLPQRFRIAAPHSVLTLPPSWVLGRGQAARPGEPGVVFWVEGSRRSEGLREVFALDPQAGFAGYQPVLFSSEVAETETDPLPSSDFSGDMPTRRQLPRPSGIRAHSHSPALLANRQILLQTCRLNE